MVSYVGVDYSMNSPAVAVDSVDTDGCYTFTFFGKTEKQFELRTKDGELIKLYQYKYPKWETNIERYLGVAEIMIRHIPDRSVGMIENYAFSRGKKGLIFNMAECTQTFKLLCYTQRGMDLSVVPPTQLKKQYTGKGNAGKRRMAAAFRAMTGITLHRHLGCGIEGAPSTDIVDAWFAMKLARLKL